MTITGASRKQAGLYYDKGGAVVNLAHPDYGMALTASASVNAAALQAGANDVPTSGATLLLPSGADTAVFQINNNITFKAKTKLFSPSRATLQGVGAVGHIWTLTAKGALTGAATTIAATINRGDKTVLVASTAALAAGQSVELAGSSGATAEAQNFTNGPQRELNEVLSVTDGTHFVLKYPAAHSYTFDGTYTTQGTVSVVTPMDDVTIENVNLDAVELVHGYNRRFRADKVKLLNQSDINSFGTASLHTYVDVEVTSGIASAGANANAFIHGHRFFDATVKTFGGHFDGVQFFGCADGTYNATVIESTGRGVYFYKCDNVQPKGKSTVQGTQVSGVTNEGVLFNYSYNCEYQGLLDERFKLSSIIEFRGDSDDCRVCPTEVHCAYTYPITWKGQAKNTCKVIGGTWYSYYNGSAGYLVDLQIQAGMPYPSVLIENATLVSKSPNTGFGIMRSVSTTESSVANASIMTLRNITYDRGASNLLGLSGTGAGQKITRLVVENCRSTSDDPSNGALIVNQLPAAQIEYRGLHLTPGTTRIIQQVTGLVDNMYVYNCSCLTLNVADRVTKLYYGDNAISTYTITDLTCVQAGIMEGVAALDFPSIAAGGIQVLTIAVTGLLTTDKVHVTPPAALPAGLLWDAFMSAAGTISIRLYNTTGAAIDPANATWSWQVVRRG